MKDYISYGGYMSVDRIEAIKTNWDKIQNLTLPGNKKENNMKLRPFEYLMLLHPATDKDGKEVGRTEILKQPKFLLAKDEKQVGTMAAREIPEEHIDNLDRVEIIVRPF
jgi:hypothetical protein